MSTEEGKKEEIKTEEAPKLSKAQQQEQDRAQAIMRKRASTELADYKKRIRDSNELKRLQVEELELNIAYYNNKKEWMDLAPEMEKLEVKEKAIIAEEQEKRRKLIKKAQADKKEAESKEVKAKPDIVIAEQGKARE